ncbi:MAG: hypothetical protein K0S53_3132 [Bacteroidetes bacterium]|nr:hypothetical protein [Bacteroidota bacterium]
MKEIDAYKTITYDRNGESFSLISVENDIWASKPVIGKLFGINEEKVSEILSKSLWAGQVRNPGFSLYNKVDDIKIYNSSIIFLIGNSINGVNAGDFMKWAQSVEANIKKIDKDSDSLIDFNEKIKAALKFVPNDKKDKKA